jgi:poly-gamma-glutamate synthesis protein (capsule biosynthesis protein)
VWNTERQPAKLIAMQADRFQRLTPGFAVVLAACEFLCGCGAGGFVGQQSVECSMPEKNLKNKSSASQNENLIKIFLCGDVMTGRGIDQILSHPGDPTLHEPYVTDAREYVAIAEQANGSIPRGVAPTYIWGDALERLNSFSPDLRLINLETAVTQNDDYWKSKGIHYRMHPDNIGCLTAAKIDFCSLANNHVLDWERAGLKETLETLDKANIQYAGAGMNQAQARRPAVLEVPGKGRVIVFSLGMKSSGIPPDWAAGEKSPGVNVLDEHSPKAVDQIRQWAQERETPGDILIASIHWGGNWGYDIPEPQSELAHRLIDEAGVDVVHGHSSHHPKGIEVYRGRPILYGCGDLINDYEGIGGHEEYGPDLSLLYWLTVKADTGELAALQMVPMQMKRFRLNHASVEDAQWLAERLNAEGATLGTSVYVNRETILTLESVGNRGR